MEFYALILGLLCVVTFFMPWVNHFRLVTLRSEMDDLRREVGLLRRGPEYAGDQPAENEETQEHQEQEPYLKPASASSYEDLMAERARLAALRLRTPQAWAQADPPPATERPDLKKSAPEPEKKETGTDFGFEFDLGAKLPVWVGAISLVCAAFFLVKYSIDAGWIGPVQRVLAGLLFGSGLVLSGQRILKREDIANHVRVAQGLSGAGIVCLYVALYAAVNLYGLISAPLGFVGMSGVTVIAVALSASQGQPIAAFGLIGGLLTPALVGSDQPNAPILFTYLFLLFAAMLFTLVRRGWWELAVASLAGIFLWTGYWYSAAFSAPDAFILVLFAAAISAVVLGVTAWYESRFEHDTEYGSVPAHTLNIMALAGSTLTVMVLGAKMTLGLFDWSVLGMLGLACTALAYMNPVLYGRVLMVKLAAALILFALWCGRAELADAAVVASGIASIYVILPTFLMRRVHDPRLWANIQLSAALPLYLVCHFLLPVPYGIEEGGFWGMTGLLLAALSVWQAHEARIRFSEDAGIRDHLLALYALAATAFVSLAIVIELPEDIIPLAFAMQIAATLWIYNSVPDIGFLKRIAGILCAIFVFLNWDQLALFGQMILTGIVGQVPSANDIRGLAADSSLTRLAAPAAFTGLALWLHRKQRVENDPRLVSLLFGTSLLLFVALSFYSVRGMFHMDTVIRQGQAFSIHPTFIERACLTFMLALLGSFVIRLADKTGEDYMRGWGEGLFHLAVLRLVWFDLLILNPWWNGHQNVGSTFLLNGVTAVYGGGALLCLYAIRNVRWSRGEAAVYAFYRLAASAFVFALVTLSVRQLFHGGVLMANGMGSGELYAYSIAWLATALSFLAAGLWKQSRTLRIASLVFMVLTVGKVFLVDAANLDGLYRVFSFLGLGVSLIGLSTFYTRYVFGGRER